jgi:hypothetical protein
MCLIWAGSTCLASTAIAAPVEIDTPYAHIIVCRPVDEWSGDKSAQSDSLDEVRARKANYRVRLGSKRELQGGPLLLQKESDHPIVNGVRNELASAGFTLGLSQAYFFRVEEAQSLDPVRFREFAQSQATAYRLTILNQGDPSTLQSRTTGKKFAGGVLSLVTIGAAGAKFGTLGAETTLNAGMAGDAYKLPQGLRAVLVPAVLPDFDASAYHDVEIRRVSYRGGMLGQIIVAYRMEKTAEAEVGALSKAIATVAGTGTTVDDIEKSRQADFAFRKSVWDACVASDECKDGEYVGKPN